MPSVAEEKQNQKDAFITNLPDTLEALCNFQAGVQDDTILHRLLDLLKQIVTSPDEVTSSGLLTFLKTVRSRVDHLPASVVVLALGVAGHVVPMISVPITLWQVVTALYEEVLSSQAVKNSSVGAAFFTSLAEMSRSSKGYEWLQEHDAHIFAAFATLETAQSMFLHTAAENLLVAFLTLAMKRAAQVKTFNEEQPVIEAPHKVMECLTAVLTEMKLDCPGTSNGIVSVQSTSSYHVTVTQVFLRLSSLEEFCQWKAQDRDFLKTLAVLCLFHPVAKIRQPSLQTFLRVYNCMDVNCQMDFFNKSFVQPLLKLLKDGHVERGLETAAGVLDSGVCLPPETAASLQNLQQLPHDVLFGKQLSVQAGSSDSTMATSIADSSATVPSVSKRARFSDLRAAVVADSAALQDTATAAVCDSATAAIANSKTPSFSVPFAGLCDSVTAALSDRSRLIKLTPCIIHYLKQKNNSIGVVHLLGSASTSLNDVAWSTWVSRWPPGIGPVVVNNGRLFTQLLQLLQEDDCPAFSLSDSIAVMETLLLTMGHSQLDTRLYSQSGAAFLAVFNQLKKTKNILDSRVLLTLDHLMVQFERHLVAIPWEIRDTTLEIIRNLILTYCEPWFLKVTQEKKLLCQAWACVQDGESYPRASAISLATAARSASGWWHCLLQDCKMTEAMIVKKVIEVLQEDTEAFARRAAVEFLSAFFRSSGDCTPVHFVNSGVLSDLGLATCAALRQALNDFDWEVKVKALRFWEAAAMPLFGGNSSSIVVNASLQCDQVAESTQVCELPPYRCRQIHTMDSNFHIYQGLKLLLQAGFGEALFIGLEDYDTSVREVAFSILQQLKNHLADLSDCCPPKSTPEHQASCLCAALSGDLTETPSSSVTFRETNSWDLVRTFLKKTQNVCEGQMPKTGETNADDYEQRPASLLEDIMAAINMAQLAAESAASSEDEFDNGEDIFLDCY